MLFFNIEMAPKSKLFRHLNDPQRFHRKRRTKKDFFGSMDEKKDFFWDMDEKKGIAELKIQLKKWLKEINL